MSDSHQQAIRARQLEQLRESLLDERVVLLEAIHTLSSLIHSTNVVKGFWPKDKLSRNVGEAIALMHSELSEALEAHRTGSADDKLPEYLGLTVELADCIIRILDLARGFDLPLGYALLDKLEYNLSRPYKHGKAF